MPKKPNSREKLDTRVIATLTPLAFKRLKRLVVLLESTPGTEAGRGLEEWIFSESFAQKLANAEDENRRQGGRTYSNPPDLPETD